MTRKPVFLVGSIRSGSTMLRLMLDGHPDISFQYELNQVFLYLGDDGAEPSLPTFLRCLEVDWNHRRLVENGFRLEKCETYREAVDQILDWKRAGDGKPVLGATLHKRGFSRAAIYWPDARFIHLLRDGRDVAPSACKLGGGGNAFVAADAWLDALEDWSLVADRIPPEQWIQVRFEDLVRDPDKTLRSICSFLDVAFSDSLYSYTQSSSYALPDSTAAERWRRKRREEVWRLERKIGEQLARFNYPISVPKPAGRTMRSILWLDDKFRAALARIRRYGLTLYVQRQAVKFLPIQSLRDRVIARMEAVDLSLRK